MIPGEKFYKDEDIILNEGLETKTLKVKNVGDRASQIGSHFHFFEVNKHLEFDRAEAYGMRLDIPAGTAVRFEPGEEKEVCLVKIGGNRRVIGLNGLTGGQVNGHTLATSMRRAKEKGFIK